MNYWRPVNEVLEDFRSLSLKQQTKELKDFVPNLLYQVRNDAALGMTNSNGKMVSELFMKLLECHESSCG